MSAPNLRVLPPAAEIDGPALLDELRALAVRYVVLPSEHAIVAVTLWIAATHALVSFQHAPRLAINSPMKRCGKSRLLDIVSGLCHRPLLTVNATVAAVFRSLDISPPPTLIIDEADTLFGSKRVAEQNEDLRALLNAGHGRNRPALRCVGPNQTPTEFPTFAMAALAGIGDLPDTITDRAVNVTMRRRRNDEKVSTFRERRDGPLLAAMRERLRVWTEAHLKVLADAQPEMPVEDRAADTWEPLIAIADLAGGDWPKRARAAALAMTAENDEGDLDRSLEQRLLADVRDVFAELAGVSFLPSRELVLRLYKIEDAPWNDLEMTPTSLAKRLRSFGVRPRPNAQGTARGYHRADLSDAFDRYLSTPDPEPALPPSEAVKASEPQVSG